MYVDIICYVKYLIIKSECGFVINPDLDLLGKSNGLLTVNKKTVDVT